MPDSICRRLTELRVQHERWAAPDSKASNGQIKDSRSILFLCQALEMAVDEVEKLKEENAELNGYAEAAQEFAKQRDALKAENEMLWRNLSGRAEEHAKHLDDKLALKDALKLLSKNLAESQAREVILREGLQECKRHVGLADLAWDHLRALAFAARCGLVDQTVNRALATPPGPLVEAITEVRKAHRKHIAGGDWQEGDSLTLNDVQGLNALKEALDALEQALSMSPDISEKFRNFAEANKPTELDLPASEVMKCLATDGGANDNA